MERKVIDCDCCGTAASVLPSGQFVVPVGREPSGAGDMETVVEYVDLCPKCLADAIRAVIKNSSYTENQAFVKTLRKTLVKADN